MKIFRLFAVALVAMLGFSACEKDCGHDFIEHDYNNDIVGTWTCLKADFAEALVFRADGTFASYGVSKGEYWEYPDAVWSLKNNKLALSSGDYKSNVLLEIIPGKCLALVDEKGNRNVFNYCANDLSDEIVGMWVCNDGPNGEKNDMNIHTYNEDGTVVISGFAPDGSGFHNQGENTYTVVGNLMFTKVSALAELGINSYVSMSLKYAQNGTSLGDVLYTETYLPMNANGDVVGVTQTFLRIKQNLELSAKSYDYDNIYVSNVKGIDKDIEFMGYKMNFATFDGSGLDKMLKSILFGIEFPDANTLRYTYNYANGKETFDAPIVVEGNKFTVKVSEKVPTLKDVVFYAFQDADNSQMHIYMHKTAFVNFYTNMQAMLLAGTGEQFDITNAEAVNAIYNSINEAVESINLSLVMKSASRAL